MNSKRFIYTIHFSSLTKVKIHVIKIHYDYDSFQFHNIGFMVLTLALLFESMPDIFCQLSVIIKLIRSRIKIHSSCVVAIIFFIWFLILSLLFAAILKMLNVCPSASDWKWYSRSVSLRRTRMIEPRRPRARFLSKFQTLEFHNLKTTKLSINSMITALCALKLLKWYSVR